MSAAVYVFNESMILLFIIQSFLLLMFSHAKNVEVYLSTWTTDWSPSFY